MRDDKNILGFWIYLMTDCILFATLFATFAVLRPNTNGGVSGADIFDMPYVLAETLILLTSSFTMGLGMLAAQRKDQRLLGRMLAVTFALGAAFLLMELTEFRHLIADGNGFRASAFLSGFFTLVGTHGLHIAIGLVWIVVTRMQIMKRGLTAPVLRRLTMLSMFWHFLDVVWICIFTIVYMLGVI